MLQSKLCAGRFLSFFAGNVILNSHNAGHILTLSFMLEDVYVTCSKKGSFSVSCLTEKSGRAYSSFIERFPLFVLVYYFI